MALWIHNVSYLFLQILSIFTKRGCVPLDLLKGVTKFLFWMFFFFVNNDCCRKTCVVQKVATGPLFVLHKMVLLVNFNIGIRVLFVRQNMTQVIFHLSQLLFILSSLASSTSSFSPFRCCSSWLCFGNWNFCGESLKGKISFFVRTFFNFTNV